MYKNPIRVAKNIVQLFMLIFDAIDQHLLNWYAVNLIGNRFFYYNYTIRFLEAIVNN